MQGVGIAVALVMAVIYGRRAIQAGAGLSTGEILDVSPEEKKSITWKYWVNLFLTAGTIFVLMVFPKIQAYVVFMLVTAIAAIFNYGDQKLQTSAINRFAPAAFFITATMLASGVFVGILSGGEPSILTEMATLLLRLLPPFLARHLHLIMAFLSSGFGLVFSGDAYLLGVLPLCIEAGSRYGIPPEAMGLCMVIGKNVAMIGSPIFASTYLTLSLAGVELKDYLKYAFVPMWITSLIMILSGLILGIIPL
jgi:CitMHS family citrate-Mg2+:H+ or citrate-Ca2+:H+ symporter